VVSLSSLWVPIALSAVLVFIASNIVHMVLPYHRSDYQALPAEDEVQAALRKFNIPLGDYMLPRPNPASMRDPAFLDKMKRGPVAIITVMSGDFKMAGRLTQWFAFCLVVSVFSGYLAGLSLGPGVPYLRVSQVASCAAFMGYGLAAVPASVWYSKSWATTAKTLVDALIYGFVTGGTFGWLWPHA
jgi:hypothetical protein